MNNGNADALSRAGKEERAMATNQLLQEEGNDLRNAPTPPHSCTRRAADKITVRDRTDYGYSTAYTTTGEKKLLNRA